MKIYTKKGDGGQTSLFGGQKVSKGSARIDAYGSVDELNSVVGMAISFGLSTKGRKYLEEVQHQLFILGADLATPANEKARIERIGAPEIRYLEEAIDDLEEDLPPLKNFILPGGSHTGATLHLARTTCRRAERITVACRQEEQISGHCVTYLNRLSDFLFVLARYENQQSGQKETPWISKK